MVDSKNPYEPPRVQSKRCADRDCFDYNRESTDWTLAFFVFFWLCIFFGHNLIFDFLVRLFRDGL